MSRIKNLVGKLFILSGKVRENEFCKVVETLYTVQDIETHFAPHHSDVSKFLEAKFRGFEFMSSFQVSL